jgi:hypothetical protein
MTIGRMKKMYEEHGRLITEDLSEYTTPTPVILDSGHRREFESGAVRDIQEGKGRCDLLPLDVVSEMYATSQISATFKYINDFVENGMWRTYIQHYTYATYSEIIRTCFLRSLSILKRAVKNTEKITGERVFLLIAISTALFVII